MQVFVGNVGGDRARRKLREYGLGLLVAANSWRDPNHPKMAELDVPWVLDCGAYHAYTTGTPFPAREFEACVWGDDDDWDYLGKVERSALGHYWPKACPECGAVIGAVDDEWKCRACGASHQHRGEGDDWPRWVPMPEGGSLQWPRFAVVPDIVRGGMASLEFSSDWNQRLPRKFQWVLPVQDGMTVDAVREEWEWARDEEGVPYAGLFLGGSDAFQHNTGEAWKRFLDEQAEHTLDPILHVGRVSSVQRLVWARRIGATSCDSVTFALAYAYHRVVSAKHQSLLDDHANDGWLDTLTPSQEEAAVHEIVRRVERQQRAQEQSERRRQASLAGFADEEGVGGGKFPAAIQRVAI